jgi:hypothetical protein
MKKVFLHYDTIFPTSIGLEPSTAAFSPVSVRYITDAGRLS